MLEMSNNFVNQRCLAAYSFTSAETDNLPEPYSFFAGDDAIIYKQTIEDNCCPYHNISLGFRLKQLGYPMFGLR